MTSSPPPVRCYPLAYISLSPLESPQLFPLLSVTDCEVSRVGFHLLLCSPGLLNYLKVVPSSLLHPYIIPSHSTIIPLPPILHQRSPSIIPLDLTYIEDHSQFTKSQCLRFDFPFDALIFGPTLTLYTADHRHLLRLRQHPRPLGRAGFRGLRRPCK